jgi:hypothetical protein
MSEAEIWRVVDSKMATLHELETTWSLDDLYRALGALDLKEEIKAALLAEIPKR